MPVEWYNFAAITRSDRLTEEEKELYRRIVADRKPYFMKYIYDDLNSRYREYQTNTGKKALREFRMTVDEIEDAGDSVSKEQAEFLQYYEKRMPVGMHDCTMNRICRRIEEAFDGFVGRYEEEFDPAIYKSGFAYSKQAYSRINELVKKYRKSIREADMSKLQDSEDQTTEALTEAFVRDCLCFCSSDEELCDILVDICYESDATKRFLWDTVGERVVLNLLKRHDGVVRYPVRDPDGDVVYNGERFMFVEGVVDLFEEDINAREKIRGTDIEYAADEERNAELPAADSEVLL